MIKTVAFYTLGCKVNQYESQLMSEILKNNGFTISEDKDKADITIINTCTVTNIADRKSRQMLHRAKQLNPDAVVVAVGCYAQTGAADLEKDAYILVSPNASVSYFYTKVDGDNYTYLTDHYTAQQWINQRGGSIRMLNFTQDENGVITSFSDGDAG